MQINIAAFTQRFRFFYVFRDGQRCKLASFSFVIIAKHEVIEILTKGFLIIHDFVNCLDEKH